MRKINIVKIYHTKTNSNNVYCVDENGQWYLTIGYRDVWSPIVIVPPMDALKEVDDMFTKFQKASSKSVR